jgi:hypothetical protein
MAPLATVLVILGATAMILGILVSLRATSRLLLSLKQLEPDTFARIGAPSGVSPPDPKFGTREMQRYILAAEYRSSAHDEVRLYGRRARAGTLAFVSGMVLIVLVTLARTL